MTVSSPEGVDAVVSCDCNEDLGRRMFINKDHDNYHLKKFLQKIGGLSFKLDSYGNPQILGRFWYLLGLLVHNLG